jgi:hypothetical protein
MAATTSRRGSRSTTRLLAGLLTGLLAITALAGCASDGGTVTETVVDRVEGWSGSDDSMPAAPRDEMARDDMDMAEDAAMDAEGGAADTSERPPVTTGGPDGRAVIRTGTMHIRATDTADVAERVVEVVEAAGGYVAGTDLTRDADGVVAGSFTFRVPSTELQSTLDAFDELADAVLERRLDEVDVTTQLTDLDAQLTNLEAYETELRALLTEVREAGADTEDLLRVFDRINDVRAEIDQANARRTQLTDQVAMSTIHLRLSPTASTGPVANPGWDPGGTARAALATTVRALTDLADVVIRIALTVLPITLLLLAPFLIVGLLARRWWRRRNDGAATDPTVSAAGQPDGTNGTFADGGGGGAGADGQPETATEGPATAPSAPRPPRAPEG